MTHRELKNLLESTNLPVAYGPFKKPQEPDFISFVREDNNNIEADDEVYANFKNYRVELYMDKKNPEIEEMLEEKFKENGIIYEVSESYIESERLILIIYTIQI